VAAYLATDKASSIEVLIHALNWYEANKSKIDGVLLLQPTSPFRSRKTIKLGIDLYREKGKQPVIGVSKAKDHPSWTMQILGGRLVPFINNQALVTRSQDLDQAYVVNGILYLISPKDIRENKIFNTEKAVPLIIESEREALDIDTEFDFMIAESIVKEMKKFID
jgi:CMP-N,N'-diacetyllegionaminic acid synthase